MVVRNASQIVSTLLAVSGTEVVEFGPYGYIVFVTSSSLEKRTGAHTPINHHQV